MSCKLRNSTISCWLSRKLCCSTISTWASFICLIWGYLFCCTWSWMSWISKSICSWSCSSSIISCLFLFTCFFSSSVFRLNHSSWWIIRTLNCILLNWTSSMFWTSNIRRISLYSSQSTKFSIFFIDSQSCFKFSFRIR